MLREVIIWIQILPNKPIHMVWNVKQALVYFPEKSLEFSPLECYLINSEKIFLRKGCLL